MKKIIVALCAFSALSLSSCKKDSNDQMQEGVYNPEARIMEIYDDGTLAESWNWADGHLMSISTPGENGNEEKTVFTYSGNRVATVTTTSPLSAIVTVNYTGDYVSSLVANNHGIQLVNATVAHNGDHKISHVDMDIDETMINYMIGLLQNNNEAFNRQPLTRLLGRPVTEELVRFASLSLRNERKINVDSINVGLDFAWNGSNVRQMIITANIKAGVTMEEVTHFIDLGEYAEIVASIPGEQPLAVAISDTIDYTYDNMKNPLHGFLGELNISSLSKNNLQTSHSHGSTEIQLTITLPFIGERPFSQSRPINITTSLQYTYNETGFPVKVIENNEKEKEYIYQE